MSNMAVAYMENLLVDTLDRLRRDPEGRKVAHLHLSDLGPQNRSPVRMKIVTRMFKNLEVGMQAQLFPLANLDLVIISRPQAHRDVNNIVHRIRNLFGKDPLTYADKDGGPDRFVTWYDLDVDLDQALALAQSLRARAQQGEVHTEPHADKSALAPRHLEAVHRNLARTDVGPYIREQNVIRVNPKQPTDVSIEFIEFFLSVGQLQPLIAPDINLFADKWLFQDLSRTMDERMLDRISRNPRLKEIQTISLNLNLSTVLSPAFLSFAEGLDENQKIVVEIQVIDVLANLGDYLDVRPAIRQMNHAILIDGLSPQMLEMLDIATVDPDYAKIVWSPDLVEMMDPTSETSAAYLIDAVGAERVVLSRCDDKNAMAWGLKSGITAFQGHFFDSLAQSRKAPVKPKPAQSSGGPPRLPPTPKRKLTPEQKKAVEARRKALLGG